MLFFVCDGVPKFYNDNDEKIYDFNFMELLRNLKDDEDLFVIPNGVVALNRDTYFENIEQYAEYERIILLTVVSKKILVIILIKNLNYFLMKNMTK